MSSLRYEYAGVCACVSDWVSVINHFPWASSSAALQYTDYRARKRLGENQNGSQCKDRPEQEQSKGCEVRKEEVKEDS